VGVHLGRLSVLTEPQELLIVGSQAVLVQVMGVALVTASVALSSVLAHRRASVPYADPP
jgi:hypothetical protein